jgi:hypothetical protein
MEPVGLLIAMVLAAVLIGMELFDEKFKIDLFGVLFGL